MCRATTEVGSGARSALSFSMAEEKSYFQKIRSGGDSQGRPGSPPCTRECSAAVGTRLEHHPGPGSLCTGALQWHHLLTGVPQGQTGEDSSPRCGIAVGGTCDPSEASGRHVKGNMVKQCSATVSER